jgi:hypothetical protein
MGCPTRNGWAGEQDSKHQAAWMAWSRCDVRARPRPADVDSAIVAVTDARGAVRQHGRRIYFAYVRATR